MHNDNNTNDNYKSDVPYKGLKLGFAVYSAVNNRNCECFIISYSKSGRVRESDN